jgi:hypothetical protein
MSNLTSQLSQQSVLHAYTALAMQADTPAALGGKLVLMTSLGGDGIAVALGAVLAGAAVLALEADTQQVKQAVRDSGCDFMVNSLDEALRILKNQVRRQRPVSVGVAAEVAPLLQQMVERGVQPEYVVDFLLTPQVDAAAMQTLASRGAKSVDRMFDSSAWAAQHGFTLVHHSTTTQDALRYFDRAALDLLPPVDWLRRRWLEQSPKYFRRHAAERLLWLTEAEASQLGVER